MYPAKWIGRRVSRTRRSRNKFTRVGDTHPLARQILNKKKNKTK